MGFVNIDQWPIEYLMSNFQLDLKKILPKGFEPRSSRLQVQIFNQFLVVSKNGFSKHWSVTNPASDVKSTARSENIESP